MTGEKDAPAEMPGDLVERCRELLEWGKTGLLPGESLRRYAEEHFSHFDREADRIAQAERAQALEAVVRFDPILAEKEDEINGLLVRHEGDLAFASSRILEAEARALAAEAALAAERERAATIVERFSDAALKCERCGDVRNTYAPGECSGERAYRETKEYQTSVAIHGAFAANRYFEKHLCRPREMDIAETIAAIAAAIRAQGE